MVSLDALRWCAGAGVGLVVLDPSDASVLATSGAVSVDDGRLRRLQALAMGTEVGLEIARYLTRAKLSGQASVASGELGSPDTAQTIASLAETLAVAESIEDVRQLEAVAANLYWRSWEAVEIAFIRRDDAKVPDNWRRFEGRRSAINTGTARGATDPINAALNYSYRLVETEGRLATLALGLDPGLGILHADMRNRDGFVLDLIEAGRPIAERHVARLMNSHRFRRRDFYEDARGVVRLLPPLTHRLAEAMPTFGRTLAPLVEHVATMLGWASPYDVSMPSVLTRSKHKAAAQRRVAAGDPAGPEDRTEKHARGRGPGAPGVGPRSKARQRPTIPDPAPLPLPICRRCGAAVIPESGRIRARGTYCSKCLAKRRRELGSQLPLSSDKAARERAEHTGMIQTQTESARQARAAANRRQRAAQAGWQLGSAEVLTREWYEQTVLPALFSLTLPVIARATGVSTSTACKWRAGTRIPHPRHWSSLEELTRKATEDRLGPARW
jgi:CRISPR-associated endonuclease Cas1